MKRSARALVAAAAVGAMALAGCSAASDGKQSGGGSASVALSDINPKSRDELEKGGSLRMAISTMPTNYNTLTVPGNNVDQASTMALFIQVNNFLYQEDGSFEVNPNYLESAESKVVDGKEVTTLKLNKKAVWGDGTPITVADYQATWNACNGTNEDFVCASTDGFSSMESVEAGADEFEVVITYSTPYPDWSAALSTVYPAAGVSDAATFNEGWSTANKDWFAGPFTFGAIDEAQKTITLERNPLWWGDEPLLDSVSFREADPSATATAFANGELDVLSGIIDGEQYQQAAGRATAQVRRAGGLQWRHFTFNGESGVLQDVAVRQALARGIDRVAITTADLAGIPDLVPADLVLNNHFFMPGQIGYQDNATNFGYDPAAAQAQLEELGWTLEDGAQYRTKDGETLEFDYAMLPDVSTSKTEGELLQSQMLAIGVKVNIKNVAQSDFFTTVVPEGQFGVTAFAWQGTPYPLHNVGQLYSCEAVAPAGSNFTRTCVDAIDELIPQIDSETDADRRNELGNEADAQIWENVMFFPLYRRLEMTAVPTNLANYGAFGMSTVPAENIGYTK